MSLLDHLLYALAWLSFGAGHSVLANRSIKARLRPALGSAYRFVYNAVAFAHIAAVWLLGRWVLAEGARPLGQPDWVLLIQAGLGIAGLVLMGIGLRGYDLGRLGGLTQIQNARQGHDAPEDESLHTDGLHRYVRHPLYSAGLLLLLGGVQSEFSLATAFWGGLYLVIGSRIEEQRLLRLYGEDYRCYRERVPGLIPWKGRAI